MSLVWNGEFGKNETWQALAYSPTLNRILALSGSGFTTPSIGMYSDDLGITWTYSKAGGFAVWTLNLDSDGYSGASCQFNGLCWDTTSNQFLGISKNTRADNPGDNEYVMLNYSSDGKTWHRSLIAHIVSGGSHSNPIITYGGGTYIVTMWTTAEGTLVFTSTDLITWNKVTVAAGMTPGAAIYNVGPNQFVVVGNSASIPIITSPDGTNWTGQMGFMVGFINKAWVTLAAGNGGYVSTCGLVNGAGAAMNSVDGATWNLQTMPTLTSGVGGPQGGWIGLVFEINTGFVAINGSNPGKVSQGSVLSTDLGVTWNFITTPQQNPPNDATNNTRFTSLIYGNHEFIAAATAAQLYNILISYTPLWYYYNGTFQAAFPPGPGVPWIQQDPVILINNIPSSVGGGSLINGGGIYTMAPLIQMIGSGGFNMSGSNIQIVLSTDISGIYQLTPGKTHDTLYDRGVGGTTTDFRIPDPYVRTAFVGG